MVCPKGKAIWLAGSGATETALGQALLSLVILPILLLLLIVARAQAAQGLSEAYSHPARGGFTPQGVVT